MKSHSKMWGPLFLLMSAKAFSPTLKDSSQKGLPLVTGLKTFQFPLHTKRPTESSLFLVKIAFVLNTPGNVGTWVHLQRTVDLATANLRLQEGLYLSGDPWCRRQNAEVRVEFF